MRAIEIILKELADSIIEGKTGRTEKAEADQQAQQQPRRRSTRAAFRAEEGRPPAAESIDTPVEAAPPEPLTAGHGA
jgi:hypothetical protein